MVLLSGEKRALIKRTKKMVLAELVSRFFFAQAAQQHAATSESEQETDGVQEETAKSAASASATAAPAKGDADADADADAVLAAMVRDINARTTALLDLVETLGDRLTHSDPFERARGVLLLVSVVERVQPELLQGNTGAFFLRFFLERLHEQLCVGDLLRGIHVLLLNDAVPKDQIPSIPMGCVFSHGLPSEEYAR
jgi:hypothetical protein